MKLNFILSCLLVAITLVSCDPDGSTPTPSKPKTKREIISSDRWRITVYVSEYMTDSNQSKTVNHFHDSGLCWKDNYYLFFPTGKHQLDEGPTPCNPQDPRMVDLGTWELINNDTQIRFVKDSATVADLLSISDTVFSIRYNEIVDGHPAVSTKSYYHFK